MRICLDARAKTLGGASTFIQNYLDHLGGIQHGHEMTLLVSGENVYSLPGAKTVVVPNSTKLSEFLWSQSSLPGILRRGGFDVYHSLKHVGPVLGRVPTVYRLPAIGQFTGEFPMPLPDELYWRQAGRLVYRRAALLIAVSDYVRQTALEVLRLPADRVVTVHNGVHSMFRPLEPGELDLTRVQGLTQGRPFLLCSGNLVAVKNFETALRAFAVCCRRGLTDHLLVLAGQAVAPTSRRLEQIAMQHGIRDRICFAGRQSTSTMLQLYNAADLLIHPSLHEGMSFSVVEAMACGLPMILARTTSLPETAGDAALYIDDPRDAEAIAEHVERLLSDPRLHRQLAERGIARAGLFTWQQCVNRTLACYELLN